MSGCTNIYLKDTVPNNNKNQNYWTFSTLYLQIHKYLSTKPDWTNLNKITYLQKIAFLVLSRRTFGCQKPTFCFKRKWLYIRCSETDGLFRPKLLHLHIWLWIPPPKCFSTAWPFFGYQRFSRRKHFNFLFTNCEAAWLLQT